FAAYAHTTPASESHLQKLSNHPVPGATPAATPGDALAPTLAELVGEILPLVTFDDAPLVEVIKTLARQANLNVIFDPKVTAPGPEGKALYPTVSIRLENVTAQNVLEAVLNNNNLRL